MAKSISVVGAMTRPKHNQPYRGNDELLWGAIIHDTVTNTDTFLQWPAQAYQISATEICIEPTRTRHYHLSQADTGLTPSAMLDALGAVYGGGGSGGGGVASVKTLNGVTLEGVGNIVLTGLDGLLPYDTNDDAVATLGGVGKWYIVGATSEEATPYTLRITY